MAVKCLLFASLCVAFLCNCHGGSIAWVKLNTDPVCFGAKDNSFGAFTWGKDELIWAFRLDHRSGKVTCSNGGGSSSMSRWGCNPNSAIKVFLTDSQNTVIAPQFAQYTGSRRTSYNIPGYDSSSPYLIFFMGRNAYRFHNSAQLRLWYGEDLHDFTEYDNGGRSCADVYGLMYEPYCK